jgi:hypothetical protein
MSSAAVSPVSFYTIVARTKGYTYDAQLRGFVHRSRTIFCRDVPNPNFTIGRAGQPGDRGLLRRLLRGAVARGWRRGGGDERERESGPGGLTREVERPLPSNQPPMRPVV